MIEKIFKMTTLTASAARAEFDRLIDEVIRSHSPIVIMGKHTNAILISEEDWSATGDSISHVGARNVSIY